MINTTFLKIKLSIKCLQAISDIELPIACSYKIIKIIEEVNKQLKMLSILEKQLIEKYEKIVDEKVKILKTKREQLENEYQEFLKKEVVLDAEILKIEDFGNIDIEPSVLSQIEYLIEK